MPAALYSPPPMPPDVPSVGAQVGNWRIVTVNRKYARYVAWLFWKRGIGFYLPYKLTKVRNQLSPAMPGLVFVCVPFFADDDFYAVTEIVSCREVQILNQTRFVQELEMFDECLRRNPKMESAGVTTGGQRVRIAKKNCYEHRPARIVGFGEDVVAGKVIPKARVFVQMEMKSFNGAPWPRMDFLPEELEPVDESYVYPYRD